MIERFLKQTKFVSEEDFAQHLEFIVPEDFNFAYDVMDEWARIKPDAVALLSTNEKGEEKAYTYHDLRELSNRTASYFQSLGIGHGDVVMLILKRHFQWWLAMLALSKLGAIAVPATHMLTHKDIDYYIYGHRHIELDLMLSRTTRMMIIGDWIWQYTYVVFDGEHLFLEEYVEGESRM